MEYISYIDICTPDPKRFSLDAFPYHAKHASEAFDFNFYYFKPFYAL